MKKILFIAFGLSCLSFINWETNFEVAKRLASEKHKFILLNFSGSDWCGPCMRLKKEIFENDVFLGMADTTLIMFNADFPRNKKNQLPKEIKKQNESLADQYNPNGKFPYTLLLDAKGKIIKTWEGLPEMSGQAFASEVEGYCSGISLNQTPGGVWR